ncbi:MAG: hypothetical protein IIA02_00685 [Proteobacteria bacterium]|uniref:hypothetical protein n=1 Tax=Aquabacterium sp. TaxID=1872578 RepID=UPI0035C6977E|nr:hypothetical protein [Pseudomonadota bacterium]
MTYTADMRRLSLHIALVLCLCWQALAWSGLGAWLAQEAEQEHAELHFFAEAHHHEDHGGHEGEVHLDDSADSWGHLSADGAMSSPALLPQAQVVSAQMPTFGLPPCPSGVVPQGCPSGLERPPKRIS